MARTYVPTLKAMLRKIERYIERYDTTLETVLVGEQQGALNSLLQAVKTLLELL